MVPDAVLEKNPTKINSGISIIGCTMIKVEVIFKCV
jgi:hypothetical protein